LPPLVAPYVYAAWSHGPNGWRSLGAVVVESDGRSLLVSETDPGGPMPDEIRVTRESSEPGDAPRGPVVLTAFASDAVPR
jgi:hypothetical protein